MCCHRGVPLALLRRRWGGSLRNRPCFPLALTSARNDDDIEPQYSQSCLEAVLAKDLHAWFKDATG